MAKRNTIHPDYVDTHAILLMAPVDWDAYVAGLSREQRYAVERTISQDAVKLARFAAYIAARMVGADHVAAVRRQNSVARQTRRALGYTYHADPLRF